MSQGKAYEVSSAPPIYPGNDGQGYEVSSAPPPYPGNEGQGHISTAPPQFTPAESCYPAQPYASQQMQQMAMTSIISGYPPPIPGQQAVDVWMVNQAPSPGCPPGLEVLDLVDSVQVERQFDMMAPFTPVVPNVHLKVKNKTGHLVFTLLRENSSFDCHSNPTNYVIRALNQNGMEVMRGVYSNDGECGGCCSGSVFACTRPVEFTVHIPNGSVVADIEQKCSWCGIKYVVQNHDTSTPWTVESDTCLWCYIRSAGIQFAMKEEGGRGALCTMTQTSDAMATRAIGTYSYQLQYESGLDAKTKAKLLMMSTYIAALYVESRGENPR